MTLRARIQLLMGAFVVLLAMAAAFGVSTVAQRDQLVARSALYDDGREAISQLLTDYGRQETAVRGYVISGDERLLDAYQAGQAHEDQTLADVRRTVAEDPRLVERVARVEAAADRWRAEAAEVEIEAARSGRPDRAAAIVASGRGQQLFDDLIAEIRMIRDAVRTEQTAIDAELGRARRLINVALAVSFGTALLLLLATTTALQRWGSRPLAVISAAMRDVTDGDLQRRIPAVGPRDVADLGADAELMRRRIVAELDSARRAEQALRSRGAIVSVLRSELAPTKQQLPPSIAMAAGFEPVKGVLAGDWYDVLCLDDGTVALCLIDVSGHGQSTGVFALQAKNLLLAGVRELLEPGAVLAWMARALGDTGDNFLTCFVAKIDPETGRCDYASAGHLPTMVTHGSSVGELAPTGPLLGPLPGSWTTEQVQLEPASLLVAYTDGLTEARGPNREEFGEDRLRAVIAARAGEHPTNLISTCMDAVHDFAQGEANDDLTIVAVRWLPRG